MKIDAKIEWVIDDSALNIKSGMIETVLVDMDYVGSNESEIKTWIENELSDKYGAMVTVSNNCNDIGDFVIMNMDELIEDLKFDEFEDKTQYSNMQF